MSSSNRDRNKGRKYMSGNKKRELKRKREELIKAQSGALETFFKNNRPCTSTSVQFTSLNTNVQQRENEEDVNRPSTPALGQFIFLNTNKNEVQRREDEEERNDENLTTLEDQPSTSTEQGSLNLNILEISNWPDLIDDKLRVEIVKRGPVQGKSLNYPKDGKNKSFLGYHFNRLLPNGEIVERKWLVYSVITN